MHDQTSAPMPRLETGASRAPDRKAGFLIRDRVRDEARWTSSIVCPSGGDFAPARRRSFAVAPARFSTTPVIYETILELLRQGARNHVGEPPA